MEGDRTGNYSRDDGKSASDREKTEGTRTPGELFMSLPGTE